MTDTRTLSLTLEVSMTLESMKYLDSCCKIRDTNITHLTSVLLQTIIDDKLILATLDDDSKRMPRTGNMRQRGYRPSRLLMEMNAANNQFVRSRRAEPTKAELNDMLSEAAANTAAMEIDEKLVPSQPDQTAPVPSGDDADSPSASEAAPATGDER